MRNDNYVVESTSRFDRDFQSFDKGFQNKAMESIKILTKNPYAGKSLHGKLKGFYSLRIGDYRVIYSINENKKSVILYFIDHRKRIYKV